MLADITTLLIPLYVLAGILLLLLVLNLLARVKGGKYVRPIGMTLMRVPFLKKRIEKLSRTALERKNPELASAMTKLERSGATRDPQKAQQALSRLTAAERKAWLDAAGEQGAMQQAPNRAMRRAQAKLKKQR